MTDRARNLENDWKSNARWRGVSRPYRGADVVRHEVRSPWGHDSFLMDLPEYHALVAEFVG